MCFWTEPSVHMPSLPHYSGFDFIIHRLGLETQKAEPLSFYILSQEGILLRSSRTVSPGWRSEQGNTVILLWIDFSASPRGINLAGRQIRHTYHTYTCRYICFWVFPARLKGFSWKLSCQVLRWSSDVSPPPFFFRITSATSCLINVHTSLTLTYIIYFHFLFRI